MLVGQKVMFAQKTMESVLAKKILLVRNVTGKIYKKL